MFRHALRAELTKFRSVRSSVWSVLAVVGLTIFMTAFFCAVGSTDATQAGQGDDDVVVNSLRGAYLGQVAVVALAVLTVTAEYTSAMIRTTIAAVPRRGHVLAAKAVVLFAIVLTAGFVASVASFLIGQSLLRGNGFVAPAYPPVTLADGPALRAVVGTGLFLAVLALFSMAVGVMLRRTAGAISVVLGLILVPFVVAQMLPETVASWVLRLTPVAGLAIQQTRERPDSIPMGPWAGLGVTCGYAAAALGVAWWLLRRRDA